MQEMETKLLEKLKASMALEVDAAVKKQTRGLEAQIEGIRVRSFRLLASQI
jgi:hypothetical protein